ncbi:hypothetical protein SAMN05661080_05104 [Modestobacter sp. DSM 44400]|nr:hypothetical protein SAMN05661080_05104 [Modestobacter sp. DSM 44400]
MDPENSTDRQRGKPTGIATAEGGVHHAYLLVGGLRHVFPTGLVIR